MATIVIDPGHGGIFNGFCINGVCEKTLNLNISKAVIAALQTCNPQPNLYLTRDSDTELADELGTDLLDRINLALNVEADIFVSIHNNAFRQDRPEVCGMLAVWEYNYQKQWATSIVNNSINSLDEMGINWTNRGVINADDLPLGTYSVLRNAGSENGGLPSVILEVGFMTCPNDLQRLQNPTIITDMGIAIATGITTSLRNIGNINISDPNIEEIPQNDITQAGIPLPLVVGGIAFLGGLLLFQRR